MLQDLFTIPGTSIAIHGYGLMMVIGFILAAQLAKVLARHTKLDPEIFVNAGLIALVTGVIGARLSHILENWHQYTNPARSAMANFKDAINITSGGLTYYGGFLLATPCAILYGVYKKVPLRTGMDIIAPALMVGLGIGRVGCFLNGCCYGEECKVPWAVQFPYYSNAYIEQYEHREINPGPEVFATLADGSRRLMSPAELHQHYEAEPGKADRLMAEEKAKVHRVHPAELYSTITALLLAAMLVAFYTLPHVPGHGFALMCGLEGATRFLLEMLRVEPPVALGMSLSMWIGIGLVAAGAVLWIAFGTVGGRNEGGRELPAAMPA